MTSRVAGSVLAGNSPSCAPICSPHKRCGRLPEADIRGVKKAVTFPAMITATSDAVTVQSKFVINRKNFGIVYPGPTDNLIRDEVVLKLSVRAPRTKG
jgi:hypothetical protein